MKAMEWTDSETNEVEHINLAHTWTIESYANVFYEDFDSPSIIQSDSFPASVDEHNTKEQKKFKLFLRLNREKVENLGDCIAIHLHLQDGPDLLNVEYNLSLLNRHNQKCATKTIKGNLTKSTELGLRDFISNDMNVLHKPGYLVKDCLRFICEIQILANKTEASLFLPNNSPKTIESHSTSDINQSVVRCNHPWTIFQYDLINRENVCSSSHNFSHDPNSGVNFFLRLWPKGKHVSSASNNNMQIEAENDYLALFLYLCDCLTETRIKVYSRFSICDQENNTHHSKWICGELSGSNGLGCERFMSVGDLTTKMGYLLNGNNLRIYCEVEVIQKQECEIVNTKDLEKRNISRVHNMTSLKGANFNNSVIISSNPNIGDISIFQKTLLTQ